MKCERIVLTLYFIVSVSVFADVTYWLDSSAYNNAEVKASIEEAVPIYNKYGSFNKHLSVYYNPGIPTAEGNYDGYIGFGGQRSTRTALHEMGHTVGMGTFYSWEPTYGTLISGGTWGGFYGWKRALELGNGGLWGDGHAIWPGGMNYENEDSSFMERIKHVQIMAAMRCDMGIMSYSKEAEHQVVPLGDTAYFGVASPVAGSYQWYKDGIALTDGGDISGATRPTLQIANVDAADAGIYYCAGDGAWEILNSRTRRLSIEGQVGQWDFENNPNDSIGSYDGTATGSPAYATGKVGLKAIDLDGINDFVTLPAGVADAKDMTVAAWVNWDGGGNWQRIFDFGTSTSNYMFLTPSNGSVMRFAINNGFGEQIVETTQLPTGQWVHIAVTLRDDTATLYVDGQPAASNGNVALNPSDLLADRNYIGDSQFWADPLFNGRIDDFRIYNYALPGSDIWNLWDQSANNPPVFNADPLVLPDGDENTAYTGVTLSDQASDPDSDPMTFSKVSGPPWLSIAGNGTLSGTPGTADRGENTFVLRVTDSSGATDDIIAHITVYGLADDYYEFENTPNDSTGSNHGTPTGNPVYTTGILGQAIDLDGSDDYVTLPAGIANTEDITIAAWVNWDGGGTWQRIFDFGNNTTQYMFLTPSSGSNTLRFAITGSGGGTREEVIETTGLAVGQWVHVAITLSGNTGKMYVNGALRDINTAMTIDPADFNPTVNYIGKSQYADPLFNGRIDDFRIYDYALSAIEIAALILPPSFTSDPINNLDGVELSDYVGTPLTAYVDTPSETDLVFSKDSGPDWLTVSQDGSLSGMPTDSDVGSNVFTVRVTDNAGLYDSAQMTIQVDNIYSGVRGLEDLVGLTPQWLQTGCTDTPSCGGADLDGDFNVTLSDISILFYNWLGDDTLQLLLKLDEVDGDTAADNSIYARPGFLINDPTWSSGYDGNGLDFDGVDDAVQIAGYKGVTGTTPRTCAFWIKTTSTRVDILGWGRLFDNDQQTVTGQKWQVVFYNEEVGALVQGGNAFCAAGEVNDGQWHHVAVVLEDVNDDGILNINETQFYIDGFLREQSRAASFAVGTGASNDVYLGMYPEGNTYWLNGSLDEVRIYNRVLTEQEIQEFAGY